MKKILIDSATRKTNNVLAKDLAKILSNLDIEVTVISLEDYDLPLYTDDVYQNNKDKYFDVVEDLTKQFGIHSKEAAESYQKMLIDKQNLKRINEELTTTWSMYSGSIFGTSISPYTGFAGQIGYKNLDTAFRHASLELKEKAGLEINYKDLLYNFDERNKEATIHTMKNGVKFVTYKSPQIKDYTFIVLETGLVLKVANDKLE